MKRIGSAVIVALLAYITYIVYSGSVGGYDLVTGAIVAIITGAIFSTFVVKNPSKVLDVKRWLYLIVYAIIYFTYYETKAHVDVIKRILHPKKPVNPAIVEAFYDVNTDYALTTISISITNTPGTVVVDVDEKKRALYIHWIYATTLDPAEAKKQIFEAFEKFAKKIFD
jgi:multicomponent Na+:H+ antiporter subunit E